MTNPVTSATDHAKQAAHDRSLARLHELVQKVVADDYDAIANFGQDRTELKGYLPVLIDAIEGQKANKDSCEWFVSYAWGDNTPQGRERDKAVNDICAEAAARGIKIVRDKNEIKYGDSITEFMNRLSHADKVIIILSDKYINSQFCMYEIFEVWKYQSSDSFKFKKCISVYQMQDVNISDLEGRIKYAEIWDEKYKKIKAKVEERGYHILGENGPKEYRKIEDLSRHTADILKVISDTYKPVIFDDFINYTFDSL